MLAVELPPRSQAEQSRLRQVLAVVQQQGSCVDLTTLAGPIRQLLGAG